MATQRTVLSAKNPVFSNPEHTAVNLDVHFAEHEDLGHIQFHAIAHDPEDHGKELLQRALAGEFGAIKPYPVPLDVQLSEHARRLHERLKQRSVTKHGVRVRDDHGRGLIHSAQLRAERDPTYVLPWVNEDGTVTQLTAQQVIEVADAVHDYGHKCMTAYSAVLGGIKAKTTLTTVQVDAIFNAALK